jgi:hypothetical protein
MHLLTSVQTGIVPGGTKRTKPESDGGHTDCALFSTFCGQAQEAQARARVHPSRRLNPGCRSTECQQGRR